MRLLLISSLALLSACSNMGGMSQSLSDMTTSSLVGTWAGEMKCLNKNADQQVILTFKQSSFPLIAQGQSYSKAIYKTSTDYMTIQIEGEMSITGTANVTEKDWIVKPAKSWTLATWQGDRTSPTTIRMKTCGTELVLTKVSDEFITELRPQAVFDQYKGLLAKAGAKQ
ncbi:hypothetical protein [Pseudomonas sp.]|uniref:hypothetical protein n=1 Tax=Pseudomonas sp. TaxID=306 RepID=UPI00290DEA5F|nr:hypothetical protein [Pseudomonas sp.]MDU4254594.1 hypothetical protein [Pseudomonas sp.]